MEQLANVIALWSVLLLQEVPDSSGSKVAVAFRGLGGVDLRVSEVGQAFTISCHPSCRKR